MRKLQSAIPFLIFAVAFLLRLIYILQLRSSPLFNTLIMDELYHDEWARSLASGNWLGHEVFFRAPLYPYFLGILYRLFGQHYLLVRLVQALFGSLTCVLVYFLGRKAFNFPVAVSAGIIAAFYPMLIYYDGELLLDGLTIFLDLLLLLSLFKARDTRTVTGFLVSGLILGLSAITRPNILIFLPLILVWIFFVGFPKDAIRKKLIYSACLIGVCCLLIVPVTIRNYAVGKDFVPISWQGGINFYIGNNPNADGVTAIAPGMKGTWWGGYEDAVRFANRAEGRTLKPSEVSRYWMKQGLSFMTGSPGAYVKLLVRKVYLFFDGQELSNNKDVYFFTRYSKLMRVLLFKKIIFFPFGLVSALSILGLLLSFRNWRKLFLLYSFALSYMASVVAYFVTSRYRMPVVAVLLLFSVNAVWLLIRFFKKREYKTAYASLAALAALLFLCNSNFYGVGTWQAQNYYTLGLAYSKKGDIDRALEFYRESVESDSSFADAHNNLGAVLVRKGDLEGALAEYGKALELDSRSADAYLTNIGNILARKGDIEGAREAYRRSLEANPAFAKAYLNLGNIYYSEGDFEQAADLYEKALSQDSSYAQAAYSAMLAYGKMGRVEDAVRMGRYALKLEPGSTRILERLKELEQSAIH
jgi:tetratricopeptide (TPR) repeat protein